MAFAEVASGTAGIVKIGSFFGRESGVVASGGLAVRKGGSAGTFVVGGVTRGSVRGSVRGWFGLRATIVAGRIGRIGGIIRGSGNLGVVIIAGRGVGRGSGGGMIMIAESGGSILGLGLVGGSSIAGVSVMVGASSLPLLEDDGTIGTVRLLSLRLTLVVLRSGVGSSGVMVIDLSGCAGLGGGSITILAEVGVVALAVISGVGGVLTEGIVIAGPATVIFMVVLSLLRSGIETGLVPVSFRPKGLTVRALGRAPKALRPEGSTRPVVETSSCFILAQG